jgi:hypothetical protein
VNRHDRRAARHRGCVAAYTAGGVAGCPFGNDPVPAARHAPEDCDGTCHASAADPLAELLDDPAVRLRILYRYRMVMADAPECDDSPGWGLGALLILAAVALPDLAAAGARALAVLLWAWLTRDWRRAPRAACDGLRLAGVWHEHGPPAPAEMLMRCCVGVPGPPAGTRRIASRPEALLTSP